MGRTVLLTTTEPGRACVRQVIHNCSASEKEDKLVELLTGLPSEASIMIFCNKKRDCEYISAGAIPARLLAAFQRGNLRGFACRHGRHVIRTRTSVLLDARRLSFSGPVCPCSDWLCIFFLTAFPAVALRQV